MIHDIVGDRHLASAVRLTATTRSFGLMFGPAIGGGLLIVTGPAAGLAIQAATWPFRVLQRPFRRSQLATSWVALARRPRA